MPITFFASIKHQHPERFFFLSEIEECIKHNKTFCLKEKKGAYYAYFYVKLESHLLNLSLPRGNTSFVACI